MKKQICMIILFLTCRICDAQNLVPNGDFEQYSGCPTGYDQLDSALFWMNPSINSNASPDYYNQCSTSTLVMVPSNWGGNGFQYAHSGVAYAGIYLIFFNTSDTREYIETPLISSLIADSCYHFQMYINLANACQYTSDNIGVYFSSLPITGITNYYPLPFIPQVINSAGNFPDSLNWTLVDGNYTATGGENYLIIGNYNNDLNTNIMLVNNNGIANSAYCLIDDVSLIQIPSCATGMNEINKKISIELIPNPFINTLTVKTSNQFSEIILYDIASRIILQQKFTNSISLNTDQLTKGLYLYEVRNKDGFCKKGKVVKD